MRTIGIAGTAKNTGKTTTMNAVLGEAVRHGLKTAITSIGYDGEEFDHLTGLPKPRVLVSQGMLVATAEKTLRGATAGYEPAGRTGVPTALGEVVLVRVVRPGLIPLAGPPTGPGVMRVVAAALAGGADLCLVDGAFGRMAPFAVLDGVVLATGGARSRDVDRLARETGALAWIFGLPAQSGEAEATVTNLLSEATALTCLQGKSPVTSLLVQGAITAAAIEALAAWDGWKARAHVTFADPIRLALAGDPIRVRSALDQLSLRAAVGVVRRVSLAAVTINPFYPDAVNGAHFQASYLDAGALRDAMAAAVAVPVVNVQVEGAAELLRLICGEVQHA